MNKANLGRVLAATALLVIVGFVLASSQGSPPQINYIDFPDQIQSDGNPADGLIFFEDPDGDVAEVRFALLEGDRSSLGIEPGWEFDPQVKGKTEGVIEFTVKASAEGTFKLRAILEDEAGNQSSPYGFSFTAVGLSCTLTVQEGQSIQAAIERAAAGDMICLEAGKWGENLNINKPLTLRGSGREQTTIKGEEKGEPVVLIESEQAIRVRIESLSITEAPEYSSDKRCADFPTCPSGLAIQGKAQVALRDIIILSNGYDGLFITGSAEVSIVNSQISANGWDGLAAREESQVTLQDSTILDSGDDGLDVSDSARLEIRDTVVADNKYCSIAVWSEGAQVTGSGVEVHGSGADLCGFASPELREPKAPQTERMELAVPGDYSTIQEAIDAIAPSGTIVLAERVYQEGLTIWKPLTLKGAGREKTILKALPDRTIAVSIIDVAQGVKLENLQITHSQGDGLCVFGQTELENVWVTKNEWDGLDAGGLAQVVVRNSTVSTNGTGLDASWGSAQVSLVNSAVSGNKWDGLDVGGLATVSLSACQISDNGDDGLAVWDEARATLVDCQVLNNEDDGFVVWDSATVDLSNSLVSGNRDDGLWVTESAQAAISNSTIEGNGTDERCGNAWTCNGVSLGEESHLELYDSVVRNNTDWGVAAVLEKCGYRNDNFTGEAILENNQIYDNGRGDVCLPD